MISVFIVKWNSHLKHVETILKLLEENKFYANKSKCSFGKNEIEFLGRVVQLTTLRSIPNWSSPKSITSLRICMVLTGYYRRFVRNYAQIVAPLTSVLKRDALTWDKDAETCFEQLKTLMTSTPVLVAPDFMKKFIL